MRTTRTAAPTAAVGVDLFWSSARRPYLTIPGPFGTRIDHRL
jgi:hypothetical protein